MACKNPYYLPEHRITVGCGQCLFCRIKKRNEWTARLLLERACHKEAVFATLTYDNDHLPSPPSVSKRELQLFFKRLRKALGGWKIRYYACGEYGDERFRPHYHAIIFGLGPDDKKLAYDCWKKCDYERFDWKPIGSDPQVFGYVAGYVSKKYLKDKDFLIKNGTLEKEFALMSRKPALGSMMLERLAEDAFLQNPYDVLSMIRVGGKNFPLGRTIREKLRNLTMSEDQIEEVKGLQLRLMQEQLLDLIVEQLNEYQVKDYITSSGIPENPVCVERARSYAGLAHELKYGEQLKNLEHYLQISKHRKDL